MAADESKLLSEFLKGNQEAFGELFALHYEGACRYIIRLIRDEDTSEEIVQATFVNIWERRELISNDVSFKSYLFRSAYNTALNYIKHRKVVAGFVNRQQDNFVSIKQNYVSHQPDFELQKRIKEALEALPPQCQRVFRLSREEGLKYQEIAQELDISVKTVEVHMGKALKLLRTALRDYLTIFICFLIFL